MISNFGLGLTIFGLGLTIFDHFTSLARLMSFQMMSQHNRLTQWTCRSLFEVHLVVRESIRGPVELDLEFGEIFCELHLGKVLPFSFKMI